LLTRNEVHWVDDVRENPGLSDLQAQINRLAAYQFNSVVAFGGGSVMDAAKVLNAALAPQCREHRLSELLDHPGLHAQATPAPLYTVATTSGTGSEVTPFATVWNHEIRKKLSLAGSAVWPTAAYVDAALTDSVPLDVTISTGLDAINQAAESIWNRNANSISLALATRALQLGFAALPALAQGEGGQLARDQMAEASLCAGLAISHTRTALCHSISYPLTAHFGVPHGLACAFTMPAVLRCNLEAEDGRFSQLALALTGHPATDGLVDMFDRLHDDLQVRERVRTFLPSLEGLLALETEMYTPGRADNNLHPIDGVRPILLASWE
jgi:alcohol dehydrogenase